LSKEDTSQVGFLYSLFTRTNWLFWLLISFRG
jgi:hypothetical protein